MNSFPTASSALSSTIILAEPEKHLLKLIDPVTKNQDNLISMKRIPDISESSKNLNAVEMMSSYRHLYEKKLQFRFVQCEFKCFVCDFTCTDEEQMKSHISEHSLKDVNQALIKNKKLFHDL